MFHKKIYRCPWCGENTKSAPTYYSRYRYSEKCRYCGNRYITDRRHISFLIYFLTMIIISIFICKIRLYDDKNEFFSLVIVVLGLLIILFTDNNCLFIVDSNKYVHQKRQFAELTIYNYKLSHIRFYKFNIVENQIFTFCFVDENDTPISHMICAATESIKWYKKQSKCKCILAFLPLGKLEDPYPADTKFYIFYNDKKIGEGITGKVLEGMNEYC